MANVKMKLVNPINLMMNFHISDNEAALAKELLERGDYKTVFTHQVNGLEGKAVAEEMFDLTNNPGRQEEREKVYGRGRSLSVGDIVEVDGVDYVCCSLGWKVVA